MVTPASRRLLFPTRAGLALLLVAGGALAGCDSRPFSRDDTASNATKLAAPRPLGPDDANARAKRKKAATARSRLDDDASALARNLNKGINPAAGDAKTRGRKTPAAVDDRPPDVANPDRRAPKVVFRQRSKPRLPHPHTAPKQVAETPPPRTSKTKTPAATATPSKRPEPPVVTEFYPTAPKKSRHHATAPAAKRRPPRTIAAATTVPIPRAALRNPAPKAKPAPVQQAATHKPTARKPAPKAKPAPVQQAATHKPAARKPAAHKPAPKAKPAPVQQAATHKPAPKQVATAPDRPAVHRKLVFWVQVGSYRSAKLSAAKWTETKKQAPSLLGDVPHRIARARVGDRGIWHRIQVGPYASKGKALQLCRRLKAVRLDCFILPERAGPGISPVSLAPRAAPRVTVVTDDVRPRAAAPTPVRKPPRPVVRHWPSTRHGFPLTTAPGLPGLIP
jgi:hypothetical protein